MISPAARPAVFLDRDGVVNEVRMVDGVAKPPLCADDLVLPPGVPEAVERLRARGFVLVCVTNQPDIASGEVSRDVVDAINDRLVARLGLDAVYVCPHCTADRCGCRKPKAGMLLAAAHDLTLDLRSSWLVGDRWVDIAAGRRAGVQVILLETPYSWNATSSGSPPDTLRDATAAADLASCVDLILADRPSS